MTCRLDDVRAGFVPGSDLGCPQAAFVTRTALPKSRPDATASRTSPVRHPAVLDTRNETSKRTRIGRNVGNHVRMGAAGGSAADVCIDGGASAGLSGGTNRFEYGITLRGRRLSAGKRISTLRRNHRQPIRPHRRSRRQRPAPYGTAIRPESRSHTVGIHCGIRHRVSELQLSLRRPRRPEADQLRSAVRSDLPNLFRHRRHGIDRDPRRLWRIGQRRYRRDSWRELDNQADGHKRSRCVAGDDRHQRAYQPFLHL